MSTKPWVPSLALNRLVSKVYIYNPSAREFEVGRSEVRDQSGYIGSCRLDCTKEIISKWKKNILKIIQNMSEISLTYKQWTKNSYCYLCAWFKSMQIICMHLHAAFVLISYIIDQLLFHLRRPRMLKNLSPLPRQRASIHIHPFRNLMLRSVINEL